MRTQPQAAATVPSAASLSASSLLAHHPPISNTSLPLWPNPQPPLTRAAFTSSWLGRLHTYLSTISSNPQPTRTTPPTLGLESKSSLFSPHNVSNPWQHPHGAQPRASSLLRQQARTPLRQPDLLCEHNGLGHSSNPLCPSAASISADGRRREPLCCESLFLFSL